MENKPQKSMYTYHVKEMIYVSTRKKAFVKTIVYLSLVLIGVVLTVIPQVIISNKRTEHLRGRYTTDMKYILFWNQPKHHRKGNFLINKSPEFPTGQTTFIEQKCPHINCYITYDRNMLKKDEDYDAIVFDINEVKKMDVNRLNLTRDIDQVYIFRSSESPEKYPICGHDFDHFFNLTWTYKLNSDIPQPFYDIYGKNNTIVGPKKAMKWIEKMKHNTQSSAKIRNKNKSVAWVVSKCKLKTKHQDFINEFRNELKGYNYTLDILGPCGKHKCANIVKCNKLVEKSYYFQLVLEEYFSEDYVTDKIVSAMAQFSIPIVIGAGDYRNFLPPGGYINAQSFDMKKLGALIDYLTKNHEMYAYFFDWKNHYYFKEVQRSQVCQLCKKLNGKNKTMKIYKHFRHWWDPEYKDVCQRIRLYKLFNPEAKLR